MKDHKGENSTLSLLLCLTFLKVEIIDDHPLLVLKRPSFINSL